MPVVSALFLTVSLALGVIYGPQLRVWSWGPAMIALGIALFAALPALFRKKTSLVDLTVVATGVVVAGWFGVRAAVSPVAEFAQADLLLLATAVAGFLCIRAIEGNPRAERVMIWGIALILSASVVVVGLQLLDSEFSPIFRSRIVKMPTGFFAHYNEGANLVIGTTLLLAGAALFGRHSWLTRAFFGLLVIAGITAVYYSRSRGGLFGISVGSAVFIVTAIWIAKRQKLSWFAPAVIALPLLVVGAAGFLIVSWGHAQEARGAVEGVEMMDNDIRLYLAGIAVSCIGLHPWAGGGSRSYGWECYRFWESTVQGQGHARPEFVHNELLQAITDYGIIGGLVLVSWVALIVVVALIRAMGPVSTDVSNGKAWQIGGVAGFIGIFTQSNFSFVFHLMPLVLLMGICLGLAARTSGRIRVGIAGDWVSKALLCGAALLCAITLLPFGVQGTRVSLIMWPSLFSKQPVNSMDARLQALNAAIEIWPLAAFHMDRAILLKESAKAAGSLWALTPEIKQSVKDFATARAMDPYDPSITINQANLLSALNQDSKAEAVFAKTVIFQGGMENAFRGYYFFAQHLYKKGLRQYRAGELVEALGTMESAAEQMEKSVAIIPWHGVPERVEIHSTLGVVREVSNDFKGAMEAYDFACSLPSGHTEHYRVGLLLRRMGVEAWENRKPSDALAYFIEAKKRATFSGNLPAAFSAAHRMELLEYLDSKIAFLEQTKVTPTPGLVK
jgi:tetratricopeptide (TPR) repeat protein